MKTFQLELQGKSYTIKLKTFGRVDINGTVYKLRSLPHRNVVFIPMEYDLPIPEGKVMLVSGMFTMQLVVDGVNRSTGKPHTHISKVPVWAYVLAVLDFSMCLGGALGAFLAVVAFYLTLRLSVTHYSLAFRVSLSVGMLVLGWAILLALSFLYAMAIYPPNIYYYR